MKKATIKNAVYNCTFYVTVLLVSYFSAAEAKAENPEWMFLPEFFVTTAFCDAGEYMWIGTNYYKTYKLHKETLKVVDSVAGNGNDIKIDKNGVVWVATGGGLMKYDGKKLDWWRKDNSPLPENTIYSLEIDTSGNVWIATEKGLVKFDGQNWTIYNTSNSKIPSNVIISLDLDIKGDLWVATADKGLTKFDGTTFTNFNTTNSGLPSDIINTIMFDDLNELWIATLKGLIKFDGNNWTVYNKSNSNLPLDHIHKLYVESYNKIWIHQYNNDLIKFDGNNFQFVKIKDLSLIQYEIQSIYVDKNGNKWIGVSHNDNNKTGVLIFNEGGIILSSVDEFNLSNNPMIYPNPVQDFLNFKNEDIISSSFIIYDMLGNEVKKGNIQNSFIAVENLNTGFYLINIINGAKKYQSMFYKI